MRGKLLGVLIGAAAALTFGVVTFSNAQALDTTRDCDQFAVIRCGVMSRTELIEKFNQRDHAQVFASFGISKSDISGDIQSGIVHRDGRVTVNGRTVATGATTAGRNMGGTPISGTGAAKISTSRMADDQTAFVKFDQNGRFLFAVIKPCGNPVNATPPPKPPEPPKPKPAAECKSLTATPLSRTQFRLNATASVENGATISGYVFTVTSQSGQQVARETVRSTARTAAFSTPNLPVGTHSASVTVLTSVGNKTAPACNVKLPVKPEPTKPSFDCTGLIVTTLPNSQFRFQATTELTQAELVRTEYIVTAADGRELSRSTDETYTQQIPGAYNVRAVLTVSVNGREQTVDSPKCRASFSVPAKESPCPVPGKEHLPVDSPECEETPPKLPETGALGILSNLFGLAAIGGASGYYLTSRR